MTFRVTMKTPDAYDDALSLISQGKDMEESQGKDMEDAVCLLDRYMKYGEYLTVEFDTEKETATVVPVKA